MAADARDGGTTQFSGDRATVRPEAGNRVVIETTVGAGAPAGAPAGASVKSSSASVGCASCSAASSSTDGNSAAAPSLSEIWGHVLMLIGEYKEYTSYLISAKVDGITGTLRNVGIYAGLGVVGLIAASSIITTACVLLLVGAAMGLAHLFASDVSGPRYWLGALVVGLVVLGIIGIGAWLALSKMMNGFRKATVNKYQQRQNWQRGQFGRSVVEQSVAADTAKKQEALQARR